MSESENRFGGWGSAGGGGQMDFTYDSAGGPFLLAVPLCHLSSQGAFLICMPPFRAHYLESS